MTGGYIDIVCNIYTPEAVENGWTGLDDNFKAQVRMPPEMWNGVTTEDYLRKMDRAGIERSLLIAVRAGDLNVKGSWELPYKVIADMCAAHPDRFSGLAGIDQTRGMQGLRDLEQVSMNMALSARIGIRTGSAARQIARRFTLIMPNVANSTFLS